MCWHGEVNNNKLSARININQPASIGADTSCPVQDHFGIRKYLSVIFDGGNTVVTMLFAGLLGLLLMALSARVIRLRWRYRVALGDGQQEAIARAMRVHANFCEYVPLTLILLFFYESQVQSSLGVAIVGGWFCLARLAHAWGMSHANENLRWRMFGMISTFSIISFLSLRVVIHYCFGV